MLSGRNLLEEEIAHINTTNVNIEYKKVIDLEKDYQIKKKSDFSVETKRGR